MASSKKEPSKEPAIRLVMLPKYTNPDGDIFGGMILSLIDEAAAVEAQRQAPHRFVTVGMDTINFHLPVQVGDVVSLWCQTLKIGRSSIHIHIDVLARPMRSEVEQKVTEANVTMVAVDDQRKPMAIFEDDR
jgi:acyl-CoA thioesterase YciA